MESDNGFFYRFRARVDYIEESSVFTVTGPERETREEAEADVQAAHGHVKAERHWVYEGAQGVTESVATVRYEPCFAQ